MAERHYVESVRLEGRSEADLTEIAMRTADLRGERIAELRGLRAAPARALDADQLASALVYIGIKPAQSAERARSLLRFLAARFPVNPPIGYWCCADDWNAGAFRAGEASDSPEEP